MVVFASLVSQKSKENEYWGRRLKIEKYRRYYKLKNIDILSILEKWYRTITNHRLLGLRQKAAAHNKIHSKIHKH